MRHTAVGVDEDVQHRDATFFDFEKLTISSKAELLGIYSAGACTKTHAHTHRTVYICTNHNG